MPLHSRDDELIQIMDASWTDAARRAGAHLACGPGCTQCCHGPFPINALDAARLRAGMESLRAADPHKAAEIERRARQWIETWAEHFPGDAERGALLETEADREHFQDLADDAPCPALDPATGRCEVYAWRPMTCRLFGPPVRQECGALGCCELCFTEASNEEIAACEMRVPHDLESELVEEVGEHLETVVAYALVTRPHSTPR